MAAAFGLSSSAYAISLGSAFTVQESAITGAPANAVTAYEMNGQYSEYLAATSTTTFLTNGVFNVGSYFDINETPIAGTSLNAAPTAGYALYGLFAFAGTFAANPDGSAVFTATSASLQLWADPLQNTVVTPNSTIPTAGTLATPTSGAGDDILLATAIDLIKGEGQKLPNAGSGSFGGGFDILVGDISNNTAYFIAPNPFYLYVDLNGNFRNFNFSPSFAGTIGGNASIYFTPEPGSIALTGLALLGIAAVGRRKLRK